MSRRTGVLGTQLAGAARRPARLLLTGLAMIVAAFVVFGSVLAHQVVERTVLDRLSGTTAGTDVVVGGDAATDGRALAKVRAVSGVVEAAGRIDSFYELRAPVRDGLQVTADPGTGPLATVRVVRGTYPDADGEVAVTRRTADRLGLDVGATATVLAGPELKDETRLTVTGVVEAPDDFGQNAFTTDAVALTLADADQLARIDVRLAPDVDPAAVLPALTAAAAPARPQPDTTVPVARTGAEVRADEAARAVEDVDLLFALVAMFVAIAVAAAALVATSTFRIVFAQRMRQLALLRAVGAQRGALTRALAVEGALTGLVAGTTGVLAALGVGHALPPLLAATGAGVAPPGFPVVAAVAVVVGTALLTVLAVLAPAFSAARVAPLEALRVASTTAGGRGINAARLVTGVLLVTGALLSVALVVHQLPGPGGQDYSAAPVLMLIVLSGTLAFFALVALGPLLVRPVLALVGWPLRRLGPLGRLAVGGIGGAPRRAAAVSVVVALGVTLVAGVLVGGASLRTMTERELAGMAPGDFEVTAEAGAALPAGTAERARAAGELTGVVPYRAGTDVRLGDGELPGGTGTVDLDLRELSTWKQFGAAAGDLDDLGPGRVVLLSFVAREAGLRPGDAVTLRRGDRSVPVRVAATLDNTPVGAGLIADAADLDRLGVPATPTGLVADAARPGEQGRTAAVRALRTIGGSGVRVVVTADHRDDVESDIDALLAVALGLIGMTVLVAVVGVGTTTALSVVERVHEAGLLRAVGLSKGRLRAMLTMEAGLYGAIGAAVGLALAVPYAALTVVALGADVPVEFPAGQLAGVVVALTLATALAGVLPARRAARVSPVAALGVDG